MITIAVTEEFSIPRDVTLNTKVRDLEKDYGVTIAEIKEYLAEDGKRMDNTHEWVGQGVTPEIDNLQDLPCDGVNVRILPRPKTPI